MLRLLDRPGAGGGLCLKRRYQLVALAVSALPLAACGGDDQLLSEWHDASGADVPRSTVISYRGDEHCETENIWWIALDRGPESDGGQYVRDPSGVLDSLHLPEMPTPGTFAEQTQLPGDAVPSGYHTEEAELWLEPDGSAVYLVFEDRIERWPRTPMGGGCD
ncbi:MAG: hypothetical protein WD557_10795 [Dehalococcoidia bacterium]